MSLKSKSILVLERKEKEYLVQFINIINIVFFSAIFLYNQVIAGIPLVGAGSFVAIISLYFLSFGLLKFCKSLKWSARTLMLVYFLFIPVRVYLTGGLNSEVIIIYFAHITLAYAVYGYRIGGYVLIFNCLSIISFFFVDVPAFYPTDITSFAFVKVLTIAIAVIPFFLIIDQSRKWLDKYSKMEREYARYIILRRINHEIGNSVNIALGYLELQLNDSSLQNLEKVESSLNEILEVLNKIEQAQIKMDIVQFLGERDKKVKIVQELNGGKF